MVFTGGTGRRTFGANESVLQSESSFIISWQGTQIFCTSSDALGFTPILSGDIPDGQSRTTSNKVVSRKATQLNVQTPYSRSLKKFWDWLNTNKGRSIPVDVAEELDTGETTVLVNCRIDGFSRSGHNTVGNDPRYLMMQLSYDSLK